MWENERFRTRVGQVDINKRALGESRLPLTPLKNDPEPYPPSGARGSYVVSCSLSLSLMGRRVFYFFCSHAPCFSRARTFAVVLLLLSKALQRIGVKVLRYL
jgi:hypothetical protein